jgi:hypothetical protein
MKPRTVAVLAVLAIGRVSAPASAQTIPVIDLSQAGSRVVINGGPGDHFDPHIDPLDGDLVSYSALDAAQTYQEIRYYRFSTGLDLGIPRCGGTAPCDDNDLLSDVAGGTIVFNRVIPLDREAVFQFDTTVPNAIPVEIDSQPNSHRMGTSIGTTVAFADMGLTTDPYRPGEMMVYDRAGGGTSTRLTIDTINDVNPALSPDGNVVVWERCPGSTSNCEIQQAARGSGGSWIVSPVAASPANDPATNGTLVVYARQDPASPTGSDIFYRSGGPEHRIALPGEDYHPRISGNLISFEHRDTLVGPSDIYLFDVSTGLAYRITDTPLYNESLNDVAVLPSGEVRVVWQSNDNPDPRLNNVHGATVTLYDLDTVITSSPPAVTNSAIATFGFAAADPAAPALSFECALDGGAFVPCTSPTSYVALSEGLHDFSVRAKSSTGQVDPTPAEYQWTVDLTPPFVTLHTPPQGSPYLAKSTVLADYTCVDGLSGVAVCDGPVPPGSPIDTSTIGTRSFIVDAADGAGNTARGAMLYRVVWDFRGFFPPLRNPPVLNVVRAGRVIPVTFSLTGDFGLSIFAGGYPVSVQVNCDALGTTYPATLQATVTPGGSSLKYDPTVDTYTYPWRTSPGWADTCRQLVVRLVDGTDHFAYLKFQ